MRGCLLLLLLLPLGLLADLSAAIVSGDAGMSRDPEAVLRGGTLVLGTADVDWQQLAWYHRGEDDHPLQPQAVVTAEGERYPGRIVGYDGRSLQFAADPGGSAAIELPVAKLAAVDFHPGQRRPLPDQLPALLRLGQPPVAGALQRLGAERIGLASALGAFTFGREQCAGFVWRRAAPADGDQLLLLGGARLHGRLTIDGDVIRLDHPRLGQLRLPLDAVHEIRRRLEGLRWLAGGETVHRHEGVLGPVPAPRLLDPHDPTAGLALVTDSMLSWPVVAGRVAMRVRAISGRVGLVAAVDQQTVAKLVLAPGAEELWSFEVPAGSRLMLACRGLDLRPASVELYAPHLVEAR